MSRRVFVTGATGFIGGSTARLLRERGDEVVAVVRDPSKASALSELGVHVVAGNLSSGGAIGSAMAGCDAVIHLAGSYRVGIPASERSSEEWAKIGCPFEHGLALAEGDLDAQRSALAIFERLGATPAARMLRRKMAGQAIVYLWASATMRMGMIPVGAGGY